MWRRPILLWHYQRGIWQRPNYRLHLSQHSKKQQVVLTPVRNKRCGRIKNTSNTCKMATNIENKRSRLKKWNQEVPNHHRRHQHSTGHIWDPDNHNTRQGHQNDTKSPQDHPKDTLTPYHGQAPQYCGTMYWFLFINEIPFLHTKSSKIYFRSVQVYNSRGKY